MYQEYYCSNPNVPDMKYNVHYTTGSDSVIPMRRSTRKRTNLLPAAMSLTPDSTKFSKKQRMLHLSTAAKGKSQNHLNQYHHSEPTKMKRMQRHMEDNFEEACTEQKQRMRAAKKTTNMETTAAASESTGSLPENGKSAVNDMLNIPMRSISPVDDGMTSSQTQAQRPSIYYAPTKCENYPGMFNETVNDQHYMQNWLPVPVVQTNKPKIKTSNRTPQMCLNSDIPEVKQYSAQLGYLTIHSSKYNTIVTTLPDYVDYLIKTNSDMLRMSFQCSSRAQCHKMMEAVRARNLQELQNASSVTLAAKGYSNMVAQDISYLLNVKADNFVSQGTVSPNNLTEVSAMSAPCNLSTSCV